MALLTKVQRISLKEAKEFVGKWHYSNVFPPHCLTILGAYDSNGLAGVASWGWGVRPRHTIQKLFPSLGIKDYWELNKLCLRDDLPKNSESKFLSLCGKWIKKYEPEKKLLFTWADGIRGKVGYVYQASGFLYGGFINTEIYMTEEGESVHPRLLNTRYGGRGKAIYTNLGLRKVRGKQFRYIKFLCNSKIQVKLLAESSIEWSQKYPKNDSLEWSISNSSGEFIAQKHPPTFSKTSKFKDGKKKTDVQGNLFTNLNE